jgi:hypothetical protein
MKNEEYTGKTGGKIPTIWVWQVAEDLGNP